MPPLPVTTRVATVHTGLTITTTTTTTTPVLLLLDHLSHDLQYSNSTCPGDTCRCCGTSFATSPLLGSNSESSTEALIVQILNKSAKFSTEPALDLTNIGASLLAFAAFHIYIYIYIYIYECMMYECIQHVPWY